MCVYEYACKALIYCNKRQMQWLVVWRPSTGIGCNVKCKHENTKPRNEPFGRAVKPLPLQSTFLAARSHVQALLAQGLEGAPHATGRGEGLEPAVLRRIRVKTTKKEKRILFEVSEFQL